jgi:hypothetical protein
LEYFVSAEDPDNNPVYFYIDWSDGSIENWSDSFVSKDEVVFIHK